MAFTMMISSVLGEALHRRGWRRSTVLFAVAALVTFAANFGFTLWATLGPPGGTMWDGIGAISEGNCGDIKKLNTGVHVLINALSTAMLAGSNYCMQCLSAPTRSQVDRAHRSRRWVDIGVSSPRNIFLGPGTSKTRIMLWLLLGLSSLPLHLLYNSAIFQSISANTYDIWLMSDAWIVSGNATSLNKSTLKYWMDDVADLYKDISRGRFQRLDPVSCVDAYVSPFQSTHSNLILVASATAADSNDDVFGFIVQEGFHLDGEDYCGNRHAYQWMCAQYKHRGTQCETQCDELLPELRDDARNGLWTPLEQVPVQACYSIPTREHCKLQFSRDLLLTVVALNLVKAVLMLACAFGWRKEPPLLTVGDAIASFVDKPDPCTTNMCLLTRDAVARRDADYMDPSGSSWYSIRVFDKTRRRRYKASSPAKYSLSVLALALAIGVCVGLLVFGISKLKGKKDIRALFSLGLGAINARTIIVSRIAEDGGQNLIKNAMLANTPQLIFSLVYFAVNGMFTTMSLGTEWSRFALHRKGLRRSWLRPTDMRKAGGDGGNGNGKGSGHQRGTYFLQLPFRLAIPLMVVSGGLHWLISQSIFLIYIEGYSVSPGGDETVSGGWDIVTCGWSPVGVVSTAAVGLLLMAWLVLFGFQRLPSGMPVVGSCSAAIAAACHPPRRVSGPLDDGEKLLLVSEQALQWGETPSVNANNGGVVHCSFSAGEVRYPVDGARYM